MKNLFPFALIIVFTSCKTMMGPIVPQSKRSLETTISTTQPAKDLFNKALDFTESYSELDFTALFVDEEKNTISFVCEATVKGKYWARFKCQSLVVMKFEGDEMIIKFNPARWVDHHGFEEKNVNKVFVTEGLKGKWNRFNNRLDKSLKS